MPDTAIDPIPKQGKFRRALAAVGDWLQALDYTGFDYTLDRTQRLERELAQLKEELRQSRRRVPAMLTPVAPSTSNINDRLQYRRHLKAEEVKQRSTATLSALCPRDDQPCWRPYGAETSDRAARPRPSRGTVRPIWRPSWVSC